MAKWTTEEHLAFDVAFVLKKVIPGFRKALTEEQRFRIAATIREHASFQSIGVGSVTRAVESRGSPAKSLMLGT